MNIDSDDSQQPVFKLHDRVIWDSNWGYEIGVFLGEGNQYNTYLVDLKSGKYHEKTSFCKGQIFKYSNELIDILEKKYGYEKRF